MSLAESGATPRSSVFQATRAPDSVADSDPSREVVQIRLPSWDGVEIAYQRIGARDERPVAVLANGLGGTYLAFRNQYQYLLDRYRFLSWDYRGLYRSARPPDFATLSMESQARDLLAILDAEQVDRGLLVGWSMGAQVSFELIRAARERVAGLCVINGTYGRPFDTVFGGRLPSQLVRSVLSLGRWQHEIVGQASHAMAGWSTVPRLVKALRLVAPSADESLLSDVFRDWGMVEMDVYLETLLHLGAHDAVDLLGGIDFPTLVLAGTDDFFTPVAVSDEMAARIPGAELSIVPTGTHYLPAEFPELVNLRLERFFDDVLASGRWR